MSARVPDIVRDAKLSATFSGKITQHVLLHEDSSADQRQRASVVQSWESQKKLGAGGYGQVWLERCISGTEPGQLRAVKEINKDQISLDYGRELEAILKFSHEKYSHCFVKSTGWYESDKSVYIAMEYFENGDLQSHLKGPMGEVDTKQIIAQIAEGLVFMHGNGFTHRDLKPANILVKQSSPDWWVKIGDFGISKRVEDSMTALRTRIGTAAFLAPEVGGIYSEDDLAAIDEGNEPFTYTSAVDIWSLGQIAFVLIAGHPALQDARSLSRYVLKSKGFPREPMLAQGASISCCDFVESIMAPSPRLRPTAMEVSVKPWLQTSGNTPFSMSRENDVFSKVSRLRISYQEKRAVVQPVVSSESTHVPDPISPSASWTTTLSTGRAPPAVGDGAGSSRDTKIPNPSQEAPETTQAPWIRTAELIAEASKDSPSATGLVASCENLTRGLNLVQDWSADLRGLVLASGVASPPAPSQASYYNRPNYSNNYGSSYQHTTFSQRYTWINHIVPTVVTNKSIVQSVLEAHRNNQREWRDKYAAAVQKIDETQNELATTRAKLVAYRAEYERLREQNGGPQVPLDTRRAASGPTT